MTRPFHHEFDVAVRQSALPAPEKCVLFVLNTHADSHGRVPQRFAPSFTRLAAETSFSRRKVMDAVANCERQGWVRVERATVQQQRQDHAKNAYWLTIPEGLTGASAPGAPALGHDTHQAGAPRAHKSAPSITDSDARAGTGPTGVVHPQRWSAFVALLKGHACDDRPVAVWDSLLGRGVVRPDAFLADLEARGQIDGYVASHGWTDE